MAQIHDLALDTLHSRLREHINNRTDDIATGCCKDFPEYKNLAGVLLGLGIAERELLQLAGEMEEKA